MSRHQDERTPTPHDAVSSVRAQLARAEAARLRAIKLAVGVAAVALVVVAALAVSIVGSGAARAAGPAESDVFVATSSPRTTPMPDADPEQARPPDPVVQRLRIAIGVTGYEPSVVSASAGVPIELTVAQGEGCAAGFLMPSQGIELDNSAAAATVSLGALSAGDYRFTCGMEMVEGVLRVR